MGMGACLRRSSVACVFEMFAQNMHQKRQLYQSKKLQLLGDFVPQTPTKFFTPTKFNNSVTSNNY